jgi:uncharacterized lipoprotein YddW (UPF0748 family)
MRPRSRAGLLLVAVIAAACSGDGLTGPGTPTELTVPSIAREFRGMWIATVANIDWPSSAGLPPAQQQFEMRQLLTVAQGRGLNAVVLQVRAAGDALYPSSLEPWSRALTGTQGSDPGYDPLAYALTEARARGLELHAWFNPFRAGNASDTATLAAAHFARRRPDLVRTHCTQRWFDPGEPEVQDHALAVILDVLQRYDVDAVHLDDFFYPYPDSRCPGLDFADSATFARYVDAGGTLARADWRRDNVDRFIQRLYAEVRATSATARVGISPFGIWRPGNPAGVTGLDAYATIFADSRRWLQNGWLDYLAPQLYWSIASTGQNFGALVGWWRQQNTQPRHLWPGLASYRVSDGTGSAFSPGEIGSQITIARQEARQQGGATGVILYNASSVRTDRSAFMTAIANGLFATGALPPATTWLDASPPPAPGVSVVESQGELDLVITGSDAHWWLVRWRVRGSWSQRLLPHTQRTLALAASGVDAVVVNAIDRVGNASVDARWRP